MSAPKGERIAEPQAKKRFGQHFLHDPQVIQRILRGIDPKPGQALVEIGPGPGALTAPLLARCGALRVIELDRDVLPHLRSVCAGAGSLDIIEADALRVDFSALAKGSRLRVVGNLPYNISTPLLFHLLRHAASIEDMVFMLQKEVVDRMCAGPGEEAYGRLSVALAAQAEVTALFDVGPGAFKPPPKVWSAVVRLVPRTPDFQIDDPALFDRLVTQAFSQRRKTLGNALRGLLDADGIRSAGIDPMLRPERLSAAEFAALANLAARSGAASSP
jgi:16S rRNA (adenine1518-N6/adenine1519-N6)-dimethyltransferase